MGESMRRALYPLAVLAVALYLLLGWLPASDFLLGLAPGSWPAGASNAAATAAVTTCMALALALPLLVIALALRRFGYLDGSLWTAPFVGCVLVAAIIYFYYQVFEAEAWYRPGVPTDVLPAVPEVYVGLAFGLGLGCIALRALAPRPDVVSG